jgi:hypothetical protein
VSLTVACVLVRGHVKFSVTYVEKLASMARRFLDQPFRFVCLTDQPHAMPEGVEAIAIQKPSGVKGWWAKLSLFDPAHGFSGRMLYLDLDTLVVSSLAPIVEFDAPFALVPDGAPNFKGTSRHAVVKHFNSSVMVWDAGVRPDLFLQWTPAVADRLWGDQDWLGERAPEAATMPLEWFPRLSQVSDGAIPSAAKVILAKKPKNEQAAAQWPWFRERWQ